jgi:integrase
MMGIDPLADKAAQRRSSAVMPSFGAFADDYIAMHRPKFCSAKHAAQWPSSIETYCKAIQSKPINAIDTEAVLNVLQPIWTRIPESASRLRGRIENILDAARARGLYQGENPARWRGHLKSILPARQRLTRGHHAALPYDALPSFMAELREKQSGAALALELCILTATRSGEVLKAKWSEIDLEKAVWTIPAIRMKAGHEHRIPLSARVLGILNRLSPLPHNEHVFVGNARGKSLTSAAMNVYLKRMGRDTITVHGFRSTFCDWASEQTSFPHEVCEMALAHVIGNKAEAAYRRGDLFDKRRKLMEAWAEFCEPRSSADVIPLRRP